MYGKSWGGFNGLQVAARRPSALKTIISTYSTDDRYADDIHYRGGCILGREMLSWAHIMFLWNARPPHPDSLGPRYLLKFVFVLDMHTIMVKIYYYWLFFFSGEEGLLHVYSCGQCTLGPQFPLLKQSSDPLSPCLMYFLLFSLVV